MAGKKHPRTVSETGVPCKNELNDIREGTPISFAKYAGCPAPNAEKIADAQVDAWKSAGIGVLQAAGAVFAGEALASGHAVRAVVEVGAEQAVVANVQQKAPHSSHQGSSNPYPAGSEENRRYGGMAWLLKKEEGLTAGQKESILECIKGRIDSGSLGMGPTGNVDTIAACK